MKLKGILDFSLGNFLCVRGFAPMGVLQDISKIDENIQRIPNDERLREISQFLKKGDFVFFPEVVLCVALNDAEGDSQHVALFWEAVKQGQAQRVVRFDNGLRLSSVVSRSKKRDDIRAVQFFQTSTMQFDANKGPIFSRIDGNHRLAASSDAHVRERATPFCIVFCRNAIEFRRFSSALFHNINYKQVPLPKEHNLRLILDDTDLFPDDRLKDDPSFGWPYYQARQLHSHLDLELLPNLKPLIEAEPRSFLVDQFSYLNEKGVLNDNENAVKRFKEALARSNALFDERPTLKDTRNRGFLAALIYYLLKSPSATPSFVRWVTDNHLHLIPHSNTPDLIEIFSMITESRKRTIFVSMPYGKDPAENHYRIIERICGEISAAHSLKPALKVERVDWFHDGTSYVINDKIMSMISDCGLLIGDLTCCNPNVYHEIGFVMGRSRGEGKDAANVLLFLDESVADERDKFVGFNLRGIKQLRFTQTEEFAADLRKNLELFFKLNAA